MATPIATTPAFTPALTPAPTPPPILAPMPAATTTPIPGGPYGQWAASNPGCLALFTLTPQVQTLMLAWSIFCTCQALFLMSRWPRTGWEIVFTPAIQAIIYGLGYSGIGYVTLSSGQVVAFARFFLMVCVSPTLLIDINKLASVRFYGININTMQIAFSIVMWCFWLASTMSATLGMKWGFFVMGMACLFVIFSCSWAIFAAAREGFRSKNSEAGNWVANRILMLQAIFYFSWTGYMVLWAISGEAGCVASESVVIPLFVFLDVLQKNAHGLIIWSTLWNFLGGSWNPDRLVEDRAPSRLEGLKVVNTLTHNIDDEVVDDGPNALGQSMVRTTADMILRNTPRAVPTSNYLSQSQSAYPPAYPAAHTWNTSINAAGPDIEVSQINKQSVQYIPRQSPPSSMTRAKDERKSLDEVVDHVRSLNQALSDLMVLDQETREQRSHHFSGSQNHTPRGYGDMSGSGAASLYVHHGKY